MKNLNNFKHFAIISSLLVTTIFFTSCKDKVETEAVEIVPVTNTVEQNKAALQNASPNATGQAVAEGLNPAHGQPGHRCDISVGAPLNTPATTSTSTSTPVQMENTTNSGGLNPAHGQPGHRCDISVGAPLPK